MEVRYGSLNSLLRSISEGYSEYANKEIKKKYNKISLSWGDTQSIRLKELRINEKTHN